MQTKSCRPGENDALLEDHAVAMMREGAIRLLPAQRYSPSLWRHAQKVIAETKAVWWVHAGTLVFWLSVAAAAWLLFTAPSYVSAFVGGVLIWAGWKLSLWSSRVAITSAVLSSHEALSELWDLRTYALEHKGAVYDASSGTQWQDVVCFAAGWEYLRKPISRQEHLDSIFAQLKRPS